MAELTSVSEGDIQFTARKEIIGKGREVTVAALDFCPISEQQKEIGKEIGLVQSIESALRSDPTISVLITPEYSLRYNPGVSNGMEDEPTDENIFSKKNASFPGEGKSGMGFDEDIVPNPLGDETKAAFEFTRLEDGTYDVSGGDPALVQALTQVRILAVQYQTNILLATVAEKRIVNGYDIYQNTMVVIAEDGKIVHLRRKATETVLPELTYKEQIQLGQRFGSDYGIATIPATESNSAYQAYLTAEREARESLRPVQLSTKTNETITVLPVLCRERAAMREILSTNYDLPIDLVALAIAEGEDHIDTMQQEVRDGSVSPEYSDFAKRYGFDILAEKHNPRSVFVVSDASGSSAGVFPINKFAAAQERFTNTSDVVSLQHAFS